MIADSTYHFIEGEEGRRLKAYKDQAGIWTIGIGNTMYKDGTKVKQGDVITDEQAWELLKWEVQNKAGAVVDLLHNIVLNQNQYDALISLAYNIGVGGFRGSTVLKRVRQNPKDPSIRDAFMMWDKVRNPKTGELEVCQDLVRRRGREADLYFKPV